MRYFVFVFLLGFVTLTHAQSITLSDRAEISVITCGPWQNELYSAFGHSAFRVYDPINGINEAYNYGVFDFDQPNFYLNFARGYLYYKLGVYDYQLFENYYIHYNRFVHEQVLNLSPDQKQKLFDYLIWNRQPENEHYRYDYFYDNCSTKMRDVLVTVFGDDITFDGSFINTEYTIRNLTDIYLEKQPWGDLGIDICLGLPMDKKASPNEYMFLPDYVEASFDYATVRSDGSTIPLVKEKFMNYESLPEETPNGPPHPLMVFGVFLMITLLVTYRDWTRKKITYWFDATLFGATGLIGLLLLLLWVATDHTAAAKNFNLLWALPTNLMVAIALFKNRKWVSTYFLVATIITGLTIILWKVLPQQLNYMLLPIVFAILVRSGINYYLRKNNVSL